MAYKFKPKDLETPTGRARIPARGKPYYVKIVPGLSLGYRRNGSGSGTWSVRASDGKGGNSLTRLADADDGLAADGQLVLDYWQARSAVSKEKLVAVRRPITVAQALDEYENDRARAGGNTAIMSRLRVILAPLSDVKLADLTVGTMSRWQKTLTGKAATINRQCASVAAALNMAAKDHDIGNTKAWSMAAGGGLARIHRRGEAEDRNIFLKDEEVRALVAEAYRRSYEFGLLVELSAVTGCRYGQLRACTVADLQGTTLTVRQSRKGRAGKNRPPQAIELGDGLANRLRVACADRPSTDPLLRRPDGRPWNRCDHTDRVRDAVAAVGLDPAKVSLYTLRHTHIMEQLRDGVPILTVAQLHETSAEEISNHYAVHLSSATTLPPPRDYGPATDDAKVTRLRAG
jgi:integrase